MFPSFLIIFPSGLLNLTHRNGHSPKDIQPLKPDEMFQAQVKFDSTAYTVAAGHKIRLALSSVHWPYVWHHVSRYRPEVRVSYYFRFDYQMKKYVEEMPNYECLTLLIQNINMLYYL